MLTLDNVSLFEAGNLKHSSSHHISYILPLLLVRLSSRVKSFGLFTV